MSCSRTTHSVSVKSRTKEPFDPMTGRLSGICSHKIVVTKGPWVAHLRITVYKGK